MANPTKLESVVERFLVWLVWETPFRRAPLSEQMPAFLVGTPFFAIALPIGYEVGKLTEGFLGRDGAAVVMAVLWIFLTVFPLLALWQRAKRGNSRLVTGL